jgi:hypothetical protein
VVPRLIALLGCSHREIGALAASLLADLMEGGGEAYCAAVYRAGALPPLCSLCVIGVTERVQEEAARTLSHLVRDHWPAKDALFALEGGVASVMALQIGGRSYGTADHSGRCLAFLTHGFPRAKARVTTMLRETLRCPNTLAIRLPPFPSDEAYQVHLGGRPTIRVSMGCARSLNVLGTLAAIELEPVRSRIIFELTPQDEGLTTPRVVGPPVVPAEKKGKKKKDVRGNILPEDDTSVTVNIFGVEAKLHPPREIEEDLAKLV